MQDRYAGDVGDFMKFGLLRSLVNRDLLLGINWYLAPDESHNEDGKHIAYLEPSNAIGSKLRQCDPNLYENLGVMVRSKARSVAGLETSGALPLGTVTYSVPLSRSMTPDRRSTWHCQSLSDLGDADIVFLDPDNGLRVGVGPRLEKFTLSSEVADYFDQGQSVVVYHHADRSKGGVPVQVARRLDEIGGETGVPPLGAVIARRGSCRFFLLAIQPKHQEAVLRRLRDYQSAWHGHAEILLAGV